MRIRCDPDPAGAGWPGFYENKQNSLYRLRYVYQFLSGKCHLTGDFGGQTGQKAEKGRSETMSNLCISSLVVRTKPALLDQVNDRIDAMPEAEVFGRHEDGRLVVVLDTADNRQAADTITDIQNQADILSATLIYQYDDKFEQQVEAPL
jgi:nitrate reductase NapAB chaperone NapD